MLGSIKNNKTSMHGFSNVEDNRSDGMSVMSGLNLYF